MSGQSASSPLSSETGSLTIDLVFDSSVANAPAGFKPTADAVAAYLESQFATPITITIDVGYGEVDGTRLGSGDLGESESTGIDVSYQEVRSALLARTATADEIAAAASLPVNDPASGLDPYGYYVTYAEAEALGLSDGPGMGQAVGAIGLSSQFAFTYGTTNGAASGTYDAFGTMEHEITEVMGRIEDLGEDGNDTPLDLFRYTSPGVRDLRPGPGSFSINGTDLLAQFNNSAANGGDAGDWASSVRDDSFDDASEPGIANVVSPTDLRVMDVLGYTPVAALATPATVLSITAEPSTGDVATNGVVKLTVTMSVGVTVSGGMPSLSLNDGGAATYQPGQSGGTALVFDYTVLSGQSTLGLAVTALNPNGAAIQGAGGVSANLSGASQTFAGLGINLPPATLTGTLANIGVANETTAKPFASLTVSDPTAGATDTVTITLSNPAYGTLSNLGGGSYNGTTGVYTVAGTPNAVTTAIDALVLTPAAPASGVYVTSTSLTVDVAGPGGGPAASTAIAASVQQILGLATVPANKIAISVSADGTGFAAPVSGNANEAVIAAPTTGATYTLPTGNQAEFLGGTASATLQDTNVGDAVLAGNAGNDMLIASAPGDTISAAPTATAQITASGGNTLIFGGAGATSVLDAGVHDTIVGAGGDLSVNVTTGAPQVFGGTGALSFSGDTGAATVVAGAGAATVFANAGGGQFWGGAGPMLFVGGSGVSTATGGAGSSTLFGGSSGHDLLVAGTGPTTLVGAGSGAVIVGGGAVNDVLVAGSGNETLVGSAGGGPDMMFAGTASDALFAGTGSDTFVGAAGGSQMIAGPGQDVFSFTEGAAGGGTVIWSFTPGQDHVALFGYGTNAVANALATATVASGSTTITLPDNAQVTFANIATLQSSDFV